MIVGKLAVYETAPQVQTISTNYQHRLLDVVVTHPLLQPLGESLCRIRLPRDRTKFKFKLKFNCQHKIRKKDNKQLYKEINETN